MKRGSRPRATARPHREDSCEHVLYPVGGVVRPLETTGPNKPSRSHVTVPIACLSKAFGLVRTVHRSTDGSGDPAPSHTPAAPKCHEDGCPHADSDADSFVSTAARDDPAGVGLVQVPVHYSTRTPYSLRYPMRAMPKCSTLRCPYPWGYVYRCSALCPDTLTQAYAYMCKQQTICKLHTKQG